LGLELGLRFVLSDRDPVDINLPGEDNTCKTSTEDEMEVAKVLLLHHFPLKGDKKCERDKSNDMDFILEPGSELGKSSFYFKVHGSLTVDEVADLNANDDHEVSPVIFLS
jgi:hypothetical protein